MSLTDQAGTLAGQPLYQHIKQHILSQIQSGDWPPGTRVPSENELVETFGVSRMTANRALRELAHEGVLSRVPGVGTFVAERARRTSLIEIANIAEEIAGRGNLHETEVHALEEVHATEAQAEQFEREPGSRLFHIVLVHFENGLPVQLEDRYVNPDVAPHFLDQDYLTTTPTAYLISTVPADELEHTVEAINPNSRQQRLLGIEDGDPCLALYRRSWSSGQVVTLVELTYPASRYSLYSRYKPKSTRQTS